LRILDFGEDDISARLRYGSCLDTGIDDIGCACAAMHEIVRQLHHRAEAVIHHRKAPVGGEHA